MKKATFLVFLSSLIVLTLMLTPVIPVGAAGSVTWTLDSHDDVDVLNPVYLCQMERHDSPLPPGNDGQSGQVNLAAYANQIWIANESAQSTVHYIAPGFWTLELVTDSDWDPDDFVIEIGEWTGFSFRGFNITQWREPDVFNDPETDMTKIFYRVQVDSDYILKNHYIAFRVTNADNTGHIVYCGEGEYSSCLISPSSDPGYPDPQIPPPVPGLSQWGIVVMAGGFLVLSMIVHHRKKQLARK